jgi:hypothetical protein
MWGPTFPELVEALPGAQIIDPHPSTLSMIRGSHALSRRLGEKADICGFGAGSA